MIRRFVVASTTLQLVASGKSRERPNSSRISDSVRGAPRECTAPPVGRAETRVHDRSAESRSIPRTRIGLRPSTTALGFEAAGGANRVQRTRSTQVAAAHPGTTRTTGGRPRGSMPRSHRPTRTHPLCGPLSPRRRAAALAWRLHKGCHPDDRVAHPDHAASPPLPLCRLEMAPSIQYSFCTARCDA